MENKIKMRNIKIAIVINIMIFVMTVFALITMYTGFKFMQGLEPVLEKNDLSMFKFFTVQSNTFMGIMALIFAIDEIKILKGKKQEISTKKYILKLMSTTAVGLTFLIVFTYLGPSTKYGIAGMIMNSNLFFHLIIPVISIVNFILFEKTDKLKIKNTLYGLIPLFLYQMYYGTNVLTHIENGKVSNVYDWYLLTRNGVGLAIALVPAIWIVTYLISLLLWKFNKIKGKSNKNN